MAKTIRNLDADFAASAQNRGEDRAAYERHLGDAYQMIESIFGGAGQGADAGNIRRLYELKLKGVEMSAGQRALATRDTEAYFGMGVPVQCDDRDYDAMNKATGKNTPTQTTDTVDIAGKKYKLADIANAVAQAEQAGQLKAI